MAVQRKAVALISGGLDSMLAARIIQAQGVHVEGVNFYTGFCVEGHTHAIRRRETARPRRNHALWVAEQLGVRLHIIDVIEEYKDVVINPKHGYGANINPCLDCKGFMVRKAHEWAGENGYDFLVTGEVVGQRPMSQRRDTMPLVARESGAHDLLLRPLSARLLPSTRPEREGWVDRDKLHGFNGRTRKPQIALARQFGLDYAQPAGGCCFLTNEQYAAKLTDLWRARGDRAYELDDIMLLKVGRHLRPRPHFKLIVGREEGENNFLEGYRARYTSLRAVSHTGPLALLDGTVQGEDDLTLAARLVARFGKGRSAESVQVEITERNTRQRLLDVPPLRRDAIPAEWYL